MKTLENANDASPDWCLTDDIMMSDVSAFLQLLLFHLILVCSWSLGTSQAHNNEAVMFVYEKHFHIFILEQVSLRFLLWFFFLCYVNIFYYVDIFQLLTVMWAVDALWCLPVTLNMFWCSPFKVKKENNY